MNKAKVFPVTTNVAQPVDLDMFEQLANIIAYQWLALDASSHTSNSLHFFIMDTMKILFVLFIITYVMVLLRAMLCPESVRKKSKTSATSCLTV